jgi:hypothetical protein
VSGVAIMTLKTVVALVAEPIEVTVGPIVVVVKLVIEMAIVTRLQNWE